MKEIYLDHHATTPVAPAVLKAMLPYFRQKFGNASSGTHAAGREAAKAVEKARESVARLLGARAREIVFTSGATESNNLALKGAFAAVRDRSHHLVTLTTEHKSVLDPCRRLELEGASVTRLGVGRDGLVDLAGFERALALRERPARERGAAPDKGAALGPGTVLASVMLANNEIGVIQPVTELAHLARERGAAFHCDAAQAASTLALDVDKLGVDFLSLSAHKIYGPKGVGALYVRKDGRRAHLIPQIEGGAHESGLRSGTLNVPGIVGFGKACELALAFRARDAARLRRLRDRLLADLRAGVPDCAVNGSLESRLPQNLNVSFPGIAAGDLLKAVKGVALSSGSACLSTSPEGSYVLTALGVPQELKAGSLRFGLGRSTTEAEVREAARRTVQAVRSLRGGRA